MKIWITCDSDGTHCLWRERPVLDDGVWMNEDREYCVIDAETSFYLTDVNLAERGIIELDINFILPSAQQLESNKPIKTRKHK